jgi:beta-phosphoglucomutase
VREIRALIFDMDGVIVHSNPVHCRAWEIYNRSHGIETTPAMYRRMYGRHNEEIIREFLGERLTDAEVRAHSDAKEALYREMIRPSIESALVPGIREFLARHGHFALALATNAMAANVDFILDEAALREYFAVTVNGGEVVNPKPHPEIYLKTAELLGVRPESCVVFEDSEAGTEAGLAAGMRVIGITTTHDGLPGVSLLVPDFRDPALERWFRERSEAQPPATPPSALRPPDLSSPPS